MAELELFVLDLKVHHSKDHSDSIIITFYHGLPTLQTQNLTKPIKLISSDYFMYL